MQKPMVSVIIPVHNNEEYLSECLDSVLGQSIQDIEIICIDDGSSDSSGMILDEYSRRCGNVRLLKHSTPQSASQARKDGVLISSGEYVMFLDGDDYLEEDACRIAYNAIKEASVDILQFDTVVENCANLPESRIALNQRMLKPYLGGKIEDRLLEACFLDREISVNLWNKIFKGELCRRAFLNVSDGVFPKANDLYAMFFLLREASSLIGLEEKLYHYCFGRGMTGQDVMTMENFQLHCQGNRVSRAIREFCSNLPTDEAARCNAIADQIQQNLMQEQCAKWLNNLDLDYREEGFRYICDQWDGNESAVLASIAAACYQKRSEAASFFQDYPLLRYRPRKIKTVALYYRSIFNGGAQRVVAQLCNLFAEYKPNGIPRYQVVLITDEICEEGEYTLSPLVKREVIPSHTEYTGRNYPVRARAWREIIDKHHIDIVFDSMWVDGASFWDMLMIKTHPSHPAVVMHAHSFCAMIYRMADRPKEMNLYYGMADGIVTLSKYDHFYWGLFNRNTYMIENPCYLSPAGNNRAKGQACRILWVGRLSAEKQPNEIVRIMKHIVEEIPDAVCDVVGDGNENIVEALQQAILNAGLEKHFVLHGFQSDVSRFYENASIYVMTSMYEGAPLSLYESASYGLPTVTYDLPNLSYYDYMDGWIKVPQKHAKQAAEEIVKLLQNRSQWQERSDALYNSFVKYNEADIMGKWNRVISGLESEEIIGIKPEEQKVDNEIRVILEQIAVFHSNGMTDQKTELNDKLQRTYAEKSEINAKLQRTYKEKAERGIQIKELNAEKQELRRACKALKAERRALRQENKALKQQLKAQKKALAKIKKSSAYRMGRVFTWPVRKLKALIQKLRG